MKSQPAAAGGARACRREQQDEWLTLHRRAQGVGSTPELASIRVAKSAGDEHGREVDTRLRSVDEVAAFGDDEGEPPGCAEAGARSAVLFASPRRTVGVRLPCRIATTRCVST